MTRLAGFAALLLSLAIVVLPTRAAVADEATTAAVRTVIDGQIAAFRADDGAAAYAFAAPSMRRVFTSADMFMDMVRSGYKPVYRPKSVTYGRLRESDGRIVQEVFVVGPDGLAYTALYALERQTDGSWKISGCALSRTRGESA